MSNPNGNGARAELARAQAPIPPMVASPVAGQTTTQGFAETSLAVHGETNSAALVAAQEAQVQARYVMALRRPRSMEAVRERMLAQAVRPGFAERATYELERGGTTITGPSIRLVEAMLQAMGNVGVQDQVLYDDPDKMLILVSVIDFETNYPVETTVVVMKRVERYKVDPGRRVFGQREKNGKVLYTVEATDDDILMKVNALKSKAIRTCGRRLIPRDIEDEIVAACDETVAKEAAQGLPAKREKMISAFASLGVSKDDLRQFLGYAPDQTTVADYARIFKFYNAIKDGEITWAEVAEETRRRRTPAPAKVEEAEPAAQTAAVAQVLKESVARQSAAGVEAVAKAEKSGPPGDEPPSPAEQAQQTAAATPTESTWPPEQTPEYAQRLTNEARQQKSLKDLNLLFRRKSACPESTHAELLRVYAEVKATLAPK